MSEYTPDKWVVLKVAGLDQDWWYRILGTWYGGFASGDSWRMNSGITRVEEKDDHYEVYGTSGSVYICHKGSEGMGAYTASVLDGFQYNAAQSGGVVEVVDMKDCQAALWKASERGLL